LKNNINLICKCGHYKFDHEYRGQYVTSFLQNICHECLILKYDKLDTEIKETEEYHKFQPDNLKYLQQIFEKDLKNKELYNE
jgi:hypothetical protein